MAGHLSGTSVPFSGRTWFQKWFSKKGLTKWEEQLSTFLRTENLNLFSVFNTLRKLLSCSADSAKDGTRKNWQFCARKLSGIFVPLSGRICARDFCPTIWTYKNLVPGKFSEIFVPLYSQRWRPKKLSMLFQKIFRDFCPTIWAYLCQGLLSHYLDVYCQQENFQRVLSHYTAKDGARKNWQFCSRKLSGIFVPLSGRICARGFCPTIWTYIANRKIFRDFCPTILPKMAPEKLAILYQKTFRDFCSTIWAYLCQGLLSHYLDVQEFGSRKLFRDFCPTILPKMAPKKNLTILLQKTFRDFCPTIWAYLCQGLLSHYLDVYCQQENFQRFLSHYTAKDGARKNWQFCSRKLSGIFVPLSGRICARGFCPTIWTYIANRKIFRDFCPTILPKMAPEKLAILYQKTSRDFCSTIWAYLCQGLLSHYLDV